MAAGPIPRKRCTLMVLGSTVYCALLLTAVLAHDSRSLAEDIVGAPAPSVGAPAPAPLAPPPKPLTLHDRVVAAIRAAGHYGAISGLLDSIGQNSIIKEGTTFFAPDDAAFSGLNMNNSKLFMTTLSYHVATSVYNYQQLSYLPLNSTIQTAAPGVVIYVTSAGGDNLRLDNVAISDPDIFAEGQVAVHGISAMMDTANYNKGVVPPEAAPALAGGNPSPAPGLITTPTSPGTANPDANDAADAVTSIASTMILVSTAAFMIALS